MKEDNTNIGDSISAFVTGLIKGFLLIWLIKELFFNFEVCKSFI